MQSISWFFYLVGFCLFAILQSLAINGIKEALTGSVLKDDINKTINYQGNILYMIAPKFFEKYKYRYWSKPLFSCIRCMASFWGAATYWPIVVFIFGFNWVEIFVYVFDVCVLTTLNWVVYKKL